LKKNLKKPSRTRRTSRAGNSGVKEKRVRIIPSRAGKKGFKGRVILKRSSVENRKESKGRGASNRRKEVLGSFA